jgi:putative membrane protein
MALAALPMAKAQDAAPSSNASAMDRKFVHGAAAGGFAEVQLGKLAMQRAGNPDVKAFGQKMVDDHTMLNNQMKPVAEGLGIPVPTMLDAKDQATYDKLSALSGEAFDKAYVQDMVMDHRKDLREFRQEAANGMDPQVKQAAASGAKVIAQHYRMANKLATEVGVTPGSTSSVPAPAPAE